MYESSRQPTVAELEKARSNREYVLTVGVHMTELLLELFPIDPDSCEPTLVSVEDDETAAALAQEVLDGLSGLEAVGGRSALDGFHIGKDDLPFVKQTLQELVDADNS